MTEQNLTGRITIVTGASRGIGRAIAARPASAGATALGGVDLIQSRGARCKAL